tara:strand:- start:1095 stop:1613 length:519 start_codon:yes stop_codon:yes gene_type:complete
MSLTQQFLTEALTQQFLTEAGLNKDDFTDYKVDPLTLPAISCRQGDKDCRIVHDTPNGTFYTIYRKEGDDTWYYLEDDRAVDTMTQLYNSKEGFGIVSLYNFTSEHGVEVSKMFKHLGASPSPIGDDDKTILVTDHQDLDYIIKYRNAKWEVFKFNEVVNGAFSIQRDSRFH